MGINNSIKHKLFWILFIISVIPFALVIMATAKNMISEMENSTKRTCMLRNDMISEHVSELLEKNLFVLHSLALNPTIIQYVTKPSSVDYQYVAQTLQENNQLFNDNNLIALTGANGRQLIRTDDSELVNISKRRHFKEAMMGNDFVSDVIVSMSTNEKIVVLEVPIKNKNNVPIGMLQRNFELSELQAFVETQDDDKFFIVIMDSSGRAVASSNEVVRLSTEYMGDVSYKFILDNIKDTSGVKRLMVDDEDSLVCYSKNKLTDWTIVTVQPYHFILDKVYYTLTIFAVVGLIVIIILSIIAHYLSIKFTKPIIDITNAADEIVKGDSIDKLRVNSNDEIAKMADAFNKIRSARDAYQLESELDNLTKLYNKMTMENFCKMKIKEFNERENNNTLIAFYIIDLDHFKEVNDTKGHQFGDKVLVEFANKLRKSFRPSDCVGRFGGDEFVVIIDNLPDTNIIIRKAEQIRNAASNLVIDGQNVGISASIGIAIVPQHGRDYDEIFKAADLALYHVKAKGRNGYHFE